MSIIPDVSEMSVNSTSKNRRFSEIFPSLNPYEAILELLCVFSVLYLPYLLKAAVLGIDMSKYSQPLASEQYVALLSQGILASLIIGFILFKNRQPISSLGLHVKDLASEIAIAIIAFLGILTAIWIISIIAMFVLDSAQIKTINRNNIQIANMFVDMPIWAVPLFCIFVGYYEELVFRGFFITRLRCVLRNDLLAVIVSSAVFASAHFYEGIFKMMMIFGLACLLGGIFVVRRSLIAPMIVHTLFNFTFIMLAKSAIKVMK